MTKTKKVLFLTLSIAMVAIVGMSFMNKTYSYGANAYVIGEAEPYTLQFYDIDSGTDISCEAAQKYYGSYKWQKKKKNGKFYYFYNCKQSTEAKYNEGYPREIADERARDKGDSAYRVTSTETAKAAYDHMYKNHRTGQFSLEFAENENIDWEAVENYVLTKYGVTNYKTNYYPYSVKGEWEPIRYGLPDKDNIETGTIEIDMWRMRITGDELKVTETFVNKLLPHLQGDGSDYQKILASYKYITSTTTYLVDDGFDNGVSSNTAIYDVFIEGKSTCIGYSIAFSYLMDKLGIESYIVDQITGNDPSSESFASVHTYNVVKLDGKFYRVDLTGNTFLAGASGILSDSKLPVSSSAYNKSGKPTTYSFDMNKIKTYKSEATSIKTTTTKAIKLTTTTRKTTSVASTKSTTKTTKKTTTAKTTGNKTTTKTTLNNSTTTKTTKKTNITGNDNTTKKTTTTTNKYIKPDITSTSSSSTKRTNVNHTNKLIEKKEKEKLSVNIILIGTGLLVIIIYLIYKFGGKKNTRVGDDGITDILNKYK